MTSEGTGALTRGAVPRGRRSRRGGCRSGPVADLAARTQNPAAPVGNTWDVSDARSTRRRTPWLAAALPVAAALTLAALPAGAVRAVADADGDGSTPSTTAPESIDYSRVLREFAPGAQWSLNGDGCCDQLTMHDGTPTPTKEQLDAFWATRGSRPAPAPPAPAPIPESLSLDYPKILARRFPGMQWSLSGDGCCDQLTIHDGSRKPSKAELDAMWPSVEQDLLEEMRRSQRRDWPDAPADPAPEEPAASYVVAANLPRGAVVDVGRVLAVRNGSIALAPGWSVPESSNVVLRATDGRTTYVWFLSERAPTRLGGLRRFAGFRFVLRVDGRVVETVRIAR